MYQVYTSITHDQIHELCNNSHQGCNTKAMDSMNITS